MQIKINTYWDSAPFNIEVQPSDIVSLLKRKIESVKEFQVNNQCLDFNGIHLDDYRTLSHYGIGEGSVVNLAFESSREEVPQGRFPVSVSLRFTSIHFTVCVRLSDTIRDLKLLIKNCKGYHTFKQCIYPTVYNPYSGENRYRTDQYLDDDMTLGELNINVHSKFSFELTDQMTVGSSKKSSTERVFVADDYYERTLMVYIDPSETVGELKRVLQEKTGIKVEHQDISYSGTDKLKDCNTLADYDVQDNSIVHLNLDKLIGAKREAMCSKSALRPDDVKIHVKTLTQKVFTLDAQPLNTIEELKFKVQDLEGIPPRQARLIYKGCSLQDDRTVADYNITSNSTIALVLKLQGD